jgi:hypothetical protein
LLEVRQVLAPASSADDAAVARPPRQVDRSSSARSLPMCLASAWRRFVGETLETLTLVCQRFCAVALLVHDCN